MNEKLDKAALAAYSQSFAQKVSARFFADQPAITGKQILGFSPVQQTNLLILFYLFRQWQEETERLRSPYFDFEAEPVKEALHQFMNTLSQHIAVRREHFEPLVAKAAANTIRLFLAPPSFFEELFRELGPAVTIDQLAEVLRYVQINKQFMHTFIGQLEEKYPEKVLVNEAMAVMDNTFMQHSAELEAPEPYLAQFSEVLPLLPGNLRLAKPAGPVKPATTENFFSMIQTSVPPPVDPKVDIEQFAAAVNKPPLPVEEKAPEPVAPVQLPQPVTPAPVVPPVTAASPPVTPPVFTSSAPPAGNTATDAGKSLNEKFLREQITLNDRLKSEPKVTLLDKHRRQRIEDIKSAISLNQKFVFINGLFKGDSAGFYQALTEVEQCTDYHSAVHLLKERYAVRHSWNFESEEVSMFFEVIERKFY